MPFKKQIQSFNFQLPELSMIPTSFDLKHKKSLKRLSFNENISCIETLGKNTLAISINKLIKIVDVDQEKVFASIVAHSDKITSLNVLKFKE